MLVGVDPTSVLQVFEGKAHLKGAGRTLEGDL